MADYRKAQKILEQEPLKEFFDEFAGPMDNHFAFDKTVVSVKLVQYEGESLLARSQAKRLMKKVEEFRTAMLDFEGVQSIGPAFADEIFRVYKSTHPSIILHPMNASKEILDTIERAKAVVLDGSFKHVNNIEKLVNEGLMEAAGTGSGTGMAGPNGEPPPLHPSYRIIKRDRGSLRKILPNLSREDQQKIMNVMDIQL